MLLTITSVLIFILCAKSYSENDIAIDVTKSAQYFKLGGNLWSNPIPFSTLDQLIPSFSMVRWWGVFDTGTTYPVNASVAEMDKFVMELLAKNLNTTHADYKAFVSNNISIILTGGSLPSNYLNDKKELIASRVDDVAQIWSSALTLLKNYGIKISFIELSNEPHGHWNSYVAPELWATLSCAVRDKLNSRGITTTISGPGTGILNNSSLPYFSALASQGALRCLGAISAHTWEKTNTPFGAANMNNLLKTFDAARQKLDPTHSKKWFATEYGARAISISGLQFNHTVQNCYPQKYKPNSLPNDAEILSPLYATRVFAYTLLHINNGFDSALYWWVVDYGWSLMCFGLVTRNDTETPVFPPLKAFFNTEPTANIVVMRTWEDSDVVASALVSSSRDIVTLGVANTQNNLQIINYVIQGMAKVVGMPIVMSFVCFPNDAVHCNAELQETMPSPIVKVTLPPGSCIVVVLKSSEQLEKEN